MPPGDRNWTVDGIAHFVITDLQHHRHELALERAGYWLNNNHPKVTDQDDWIMIGGKFQPDRAVLWLALFRASELSSVIRPQRIYLEYARACSDYTPGLERKIRRIGRVVPWYLLRARLKNRQQARRLVLR